MATILELSEYRENRRELRAEGGPDTTGRILLFTGIRYERHSIPDPEQASALDQEDMPPAHERN